MLLEPKRYFHLLSALRGVAAILVVLRHTNAIFAPIQFPMSFMAVDVFFLLSGVVIEASYRRKLMLGLTPLHFTWIRIARIYPLYILGSGLTLLTILISPGHNLFAGAAPYLIHRKLVAWILSMLLIPNMFPDSREFPYDHPAWSLFFELAVNIFYAFIVIKLSKRRLIGLIGIAGAGLLSSLVLLHHRNIIDLGWSHTTFFCGFFRTGLSFFLGVMIYRIYLAKPLPFITRHSGIFSTLIVIAVTAILVVPLPARFGALFYVLSVFIFFPTLIYAGLAVEPGKLTLPVWKFLGDVSYAVYTFHVPIYILLSSVLISALGLSITGDAPWLGFGFLAAVISLAVVLDRVYDQPMQKFLRSMWRENLTAPGVKSKLLLR